MSLVSVMSLSRVSLTVSRFCCTWHPMLESDFENPSSLLRRSTRVADDDGSLSADSTAEKMSLMPVAREVPLPLRSWSVE